jgi:hypothetical protein
MPVNYSNFLSSCVCTVDALPTKTTNACECTTWSGRLNDLYFIECSETINATNLLDLAWWEAAIMNQKLFNLGIGIGSYAKKNLTTFDVGGCGTATVQQIEWALTYNVYCIDKSTQYFNHEFADAMLKGAYKNYNMIGRFCDGDDVILPIGKVNLSDFDSVLPASNDEFMNFVYEFSWKGLNVPTPLTVAGLSVVLPKAV